MGAAASIAAPAAPPGKSQSAKKGEVAWKARLIANLVTAAAGIVQQQMVLDERVTARPRNSVGCCVAFLFMCVKLYAESKDFRSKWYKFALRKRYSLRRITILIVPELGNFALAMAAIHGHEVDDYQYKVGERTANNLVRCSLALNMFVKVIHENWLALTSWMFPKADVAPSEENTHGIP